MLFLHVRGKGILQLKVVIVTDITLGLPRIIGASHRSVANVNDIFHWRADNMLGAAIGTAALGDRAGNGITVSRRKSVSQILSWSFVYRVLLPLGNTCAAIELMVWHR